jgi:hypothetical protein
MRKLNPETIPVTEIKATFISTTEVKHPKGMLHFKYNDDFMTVFTLNNDTTPYFICISNDFEVDHDVPNEIRINLWKAKEILFRPRFTSNIHEKIDSCDIPSWLTKFKELEVLRLDYVNIDEIELVKDLPIKSLALSNISCSNFDMFIKKLESMVLLQEIYYDQSIDISVFKFSDSCKIKLLPL